MMAVVGGRFGSTELVAMYAVLGRSGVWTPCLARRSPQHGMDLSAHGLPICAALVCVAFMIYAASSRAA
jgi:hypothetical protein